MRRFLFFFLSLSAFFVNTQAATLNGGTKPLMRSEGLVDQPAPNNNKISIVLPCLNESFYTLNTVRSFCERTPDDMLQEILVVDDGSSPPLEELLRDHVDERCRLKVIRHSKAMGLMVAKQTGGDASSGKYVGFFDCHVAPNVGWYKEIVNLLEEKPRRLVVPQIGDLNLTSWDQKTNGALTAKCYMGWNAEFWWYDDDTDFIPEISGGLVATTQKWWRESGGFEKGMRGWGGENTDQSLRTWLCGGDIVRAKSSIVAHMWRIGDKQTNAHYKMGNVQTDNQARVAAAWYDEFKPVFRGGHSMLENIDISDTLKKKEELQCKPFVHFLHRFRKLYREGGMLPDKVYKISLASDPSMCMSRSGDGYSLHSCNDATWFNDGNWIPWNMVLPPPSPLLETESNESVKEVVCGAHKALGCAACPQGNGEGYCHGDCGWVFGACVAKELIEVERKKQHHGTCCSGIREWRTIDCFDQLGKGGPMAYNCDLSGYNVNQQYLFDEHGRIRHQSGKCISYLGTEIKAADCATAAKWKKIDSFEPLETKMYKESVVKHNLTDDMPDH